MIEVELPDGAIAEFPEGTPPETIKSALQKRFAPNPPKPLGRRIWENVVGDDDPTTQNFGEKAGTWLNKAGESMTFGLVGDEASAAVESLAPGVNYGDRRDHYRQQEEILERENPGAALTADLGGAVAGALLPFGAIGTLSRAASTPARIAASAATGAGMGGTYGFMEGEGRDDRLREMQTGAGIGLAAGAAAPIFAGGIQKGADAIVGRRALRRAAAGAPSTDALRREGAALYDAVDNAGVQIKPQAFERTRQDIMDALSQRTGFDALPGPGSLTPNTARVAQIMEEASAQMQATPTAALPFKSLDQMRRQAGAAAGNVTNRTDRQAGATVIEGMDDFVRGLKDSDVVAGDVQALQTALPKARDVWRRMSKSQLVEDALANEQNYLSGGASAIRNRFASMLRNPKIAQNFSEAEKKAMQRVVSGSIPQQIINYLGSGLGMMGQIGLGAATGGPLGALAGTAGAAASRKLSEDMTRRNAEMVRALIANGKLNTLPVATDRVRGLVEALTRRTAAAAPQ